MPDHATAQITAEINKLPIKALTEIGKVSSAWTYLETEFDLALECLLIHPKAKGLHDDYIILPFKTRLGIMRDAGKLVYETAVFAKFDRVLSAVANAHGKRDPIIHGRFVPHSNRRFQIQNHRHTGRGGMWKMRADWSSTKKLRSATETIIKAAGQFIAFNRAHLPGSPASWLDIPPQPYKKRARPRRRANPTRSTRQKL